MTGVQTAPRDSQLYQRDLPGGGYVAIEIDARLGGLTPGRARILVERRCDPLRRDGHEPPVIADVEGRDSGDVFLELYRIAADNVAVARGLLDWQRRPRAEGTR